MSPFWEKGVGRMRLAFFLLVMLTIVLQAYEIWTDQDAKTENGKFKKAMADSQAFVLKVIGDVPLDKDGDPIKTLVQRIADVDQHVTDIKDDVHSQLVNAVKNIGDFTREGRTRIIENSGNIMATKDAVVALSNKMDHVVLKAEQSTAASQATRVHAAIVQKKVLQRLPKPTPKPWIHFP